MCMRMRQQPPDLLQTAVRTPLGDFHLAWSSVGLRRLTLRKMGRQSLHSHPDWNDAAWSSQGPTWIESLRSHLQAYATGNPVQFDFVRLDETGIPPFHRAVYQQVRQLTWGQTAQYGQLAAALGRPGGARAVGQAMARNPFLVVVPCHRVLAANQKLGGFSAEGGVSTKRCMLDLEKSLPSPTASRSPWGEAEDFLSKKDPKMAAIIRRLGPCALAPSPATSPHAYLCRSILFQQLSGKAAQRILQRLEDAVGGGRMPTPEQILHTSVEDLRACGISGAKAAALHSVSAHAAQLPSRRQLDTMGDEEIIQTLLPMRGVGRWTAQMFLIFYLNRPDVFPPQDYGIRKGFQKLYGGKELPSPAQIDGHAAQAWAPHRTVASWYLWRLLDAEEV